MTDLHLEVTGVTWQIRATPRRRPQIRLIGTVWKVDRQLTKRSMDA